jgi:hypothetical protein
MPGCYGAAYADIHFNPGAEPVNDRHEAIDGKSREIRIANAREVGGGNPSASVRGANAQALPVERFELLDIGALVPEVPENISTSANQFQLLALHRNLSLSLFNRSFIKSISCRGVLMPWVDFF